VNKVKVLLKCVYGDKKPGEQAELDEKTANYYASMGWMKILETVKEPEAKKESKPEPKKTSKKK
jgi:hypothetical protein